MTPWDLSCPDWEDRIRTGRSIIPALPGLNHEWAELGLAFFDALCLPDLPHQPKMRDACGEWFRDIVRVVFGSWDPVLKHRFIRDILLMAPKGQSKTSYSAGLMLTAMMMNDRPQAEMLFIGPTQAISDRAFQQVVGMIEADPELERRFRPREHLKTIEDLMVPNAAMKVKTFDLSILTGALPVFVLLDELHLLGGKAFTAKVLRQIRGGLEKRPEGLFLITTTQSDDIPAGAYAEEVLTARMTRDSAAYGRGKRPLLPVLYEFPKDIATDPAKWQDSRNWHMVMPNLGRSVQLASLLADWETERAKGPAAVKLWASQHLNIEIGLGLHTDRWAGAEYWEGSGDPTLTLEELIRRCDVITCGIDGGGLDDLLGLAFIGREIGTGRWLIWNRAWAHPGVLERRKSEAGRLMDFVASGDLILESRVSSHVTDVVELVMQVFEAGLLGGVGVDPVGISEIVIELARAGIDRDTMVRGIPQGWRMSGAIKDLERQLAKGDAIHAAQGLMAWCVGNAKAEARGNAISITKQAAGSAKIDPFIAALDAVELMRGDPEPMGASVYDNRGIILI